MSQRYDMGITTAEEALTFCKRWCAYMNRKRRAKQMKLLAESNMTFKQFVNKRYGKMGTKGVNDEIIDALAEKFDHPPYGGQEWNYSFDNVSGILLIYH